MELTRQMKWRVKAELEEAVPMHGRYSDPQMAVEAQGLFLCALSQGAEEMLIHDHCVGFTPACSPATAAVYCDFRVPGVPATQAGASYFCLCLQRDNNLKEGISQLFELSCMFVLGYSFYFLI